MDEVYQRIKTDAETEITIEKSRFIAHSKKTETEDEAREFISATKKAHPFATHNCYAYVLSDGTARFSDDGEPQGTAGMPILECIKNKQLVDTAVVITRYFGGIKLGAGGLVRAYSGATAEVLNLSGTEEKILSDIYKLTFSYDKYSIFLKHDEKEKSIVLSTDFLSDVVVKVAIPSSDNLYIAKLIDLLSGKVETEKLAQEYKVYK